MAKTYTFRSGSHVKGNPQIVGEALELLQADNAGRLTARIVVEAARPAESPLHGSFEWDDLRAAELYREEQARQVISSVRVITQSGTQQKVERAYVNVVENVGGDEQRGYVPMARVLSDGELYRQVCEQAAKDLKSWEDRYSEFETLASIGRSARERIEQLPLEVAV